MISEKDRKEIKEKILSEIEKAKNKIEELKELTKPLPPDCAIGRVSRMDAINNRPINELGLRKQKEKLQKLEYAFSKIGDDKFGVCANCNNPIQLGRIMLMPQSNFCVGCTARR